MIYDPGKMETWDELQARQEQGRPQSQTVRLHTATYGTLVKQLFICLIACIKQPSFACINDAVDEAKRNSEAGAEQRA